ncbi:hypothetical protein ANANG_G00176860 [Anguilla anguilla]|uniref:Uncharacterized protein n=1 Tax=Anguilla anguilla TaxID=7936 RepID=A0A9D3RUL3_ANGAN|nr:hypothetical protein ANANG_G00176860 [Anguilla anguilla]
MSSGPVGRRASRKPRSWGALFLNVPVVSRHLLKTSHAVQTNGQPPWSKPRTDVREDM